MFGYITLQLLLLLLVLWLLRRGMKDIYYYIRFACNAKFICSSGTRSNILYLYRCLFVFAIIMHFNFGAFFATFFAPAFCIFCNCCFLFFIA